MINKIRTYIRSNFFTLALLVLVLSYLAYQRLPAFLNDRELIGSAAPDFTLPVMAEREGETDGVVTLSELRGKKVLLNFWGTWCGPCVSEVPALIEITDELRGANFVMLAITEENPGVVRSFAREKGINYPVVFDNAARVHRDYRVNLFPTMVWIDEQGNVESIGHGLDFVLTYKIREWVTGSYFAENDGGES